MAATSRTCRAISCPSLVARGCPAPAPWHRRHDLSTLCMHLVAFPLRISASGRGYAGRYIHFGVREHAMLAILPLGLCNPRCGSSFGTFRNGICSYSLIIPYGVTFTVFFQYGLPAIRMAAISKFPVFYIGTHDSIDLGEDGPTHQPVEVMPQLRAMPNLLVIRPADVNETVGAFEVMAEQYASPRDAWASRFCLRISGFIHVLSFYLSLFCSVMAGGFRTSASTWTPSRSRAGPSS